jgi:DNA-binding response OmpR family regulator
MRSGDALRKPFTAEQLAAHIHEVMGRDAALPATHISSAGVEVDLEERTVTRDGDPVALTRTEWALLTYLAANPRRLLTGGDILSQVWGPEYREDLQFLRVWVSRLRAKLGGPGSQLLIRTVRGIGYIFEPDGEPTEASEQRPPRRGSRAISTR